MRKSGSFTECPKCGSNANQVVYAGGQLAPKCQGSGVIGCKGLEHMHRVCLGCGYGIAEYPIGDHPDERYRHKVTVSRELDGDAVLAKLLPKGFPMLSYLRGKLRR